MSLSDPVDARRGGGARVSAWLHYDDASSGRSGKRDLLRALGIRGRKSYPVQARVKGERLVLRCDARSSTASAPLRGAQRSYLEREDARGPDSRMVYQDGVGHPDNVLQNAPIETWPERWSIWLNPTEHDVNPATAERMLTEELGRRFGIDEKDVYVVMHVDPERTGKDGVTQPRGWHLHAVVPAQPGMKLDRATMREIGQLIVKELVLERAVERALDPERRRPVESGWDLSATDKQVAILEGSGRTAADLTRGEASLAIEAILGERSWARDRGR